MNLENFHTFLNEPANLHRVSYSELKSLVAEYPFSANLRILLLLKSKLEKNPDLGQNLKLAAAYSPNRSVLYQVMHDSKLMQAIQDEAIEQEEILELLDLSEVKSLLEREEEENADAENERTMERTIPASDVPEATSDNIWTKGIFEEDEPSISMPGASVISIDTLLSSINDETEEPGIFENTGSDIVEHREEEFEHEEIKASHEMLINFTAINLSGYSKMLSEFELTSDDLPLEVELPIKPQLQEPIEPKVIKPQPKDSFSSWMAQIEKDLNRELEVPDINKHLEILEAGKLSVTKEHVPESSVKKVTSNAEETFLEAPIEEKNSEASEFNVNFDEIIEEGKEEVTEIEASPNDESIIKVIIPDELDEQTEAELDAAEEKATKKRVKEIAKRSLSLNNEIVSETLAKLLVQQERYEKAIDMYQKLILKFPESEPKFTTEIERIKELK